MIVAVDVHYHFDRTIAAGVVFAEWTSSSPTRLVTDAFGEPHAYAPGLFFKRELPFILGLLEKLKGEFDTVIIDGYVWLDFHRPGLGAHLYAELGPDIAVVGVAKSRFKSDEHAIPVIRGRSIRPLYITAAGMDRTVAAGHVKAMHGPHRIPTMLKLADTICRSTTCG